MSLNVQIIQPTEILDGTTAAALHQAVSQALNTAATVILVDCQAVTFMDSSGLGALVLALKMSRAQGCRFCLCAINQQVDMLFNLTDTHQVFEIYPDRAAFEAKVT
ncbi:MAG: STAS domain-containing protein [Cyanobacteria bacterium P01_A01_bin.17]